MESALDYLKKWKNARTGILTNQTGWNGEYHFQSLHGFLDVIRVFIPEHGLFGELQDQVSGRDLQYESDHCEFWNLYGDTEESLIPPDDKLTDLDLLIIDIRDIGSRYYTFLTTAYYILKKISELTRNSESTPCVIVFDSPNPIGRKVEGTPLYPGYSSFVGIQGVVHRHGLSSGELLSFYKERDSLNIELEVIPPGVFHPQNYDAFSWIPPSPNIPALTTCYVYPGQCLLEGTNLSEGRGTTRPFEIFGAPYIQSENAYLKKEMESYSSGSFVLRPLRFKPTFHKHSGKICEGYQLHLVQPEKFHSLFFTLHLLRTIRILYPRDFEFLSGCYEFRSDRPAIELLVGDPILLNYINGMGRTKDIQDYLYEEEKKWEKEIAHIQG